MAEKKELRKHKGRYSYLNDFKLNDNNEYEYMGNVYQLDLSGSEKKTALSRLRNFCIALFAVVILGGFLPFEAMRGAFYVILPFFFEVVFTIWLATCVYTVLRNETLREYQHKKSFERIKPFSGTVMVNAAIGLFASVLYLTINGTGNLFTVILYLLCKIGAFLLGKQTASSADLLSYRKIQEKKE